MIRRVYTAYTVEFTKAIRQRYTYLGPAVVILMILAAPLAHPIDRDGASDYAFIAYSVPLALNVVGCLLLIAYCAALVSTELGSGTIRSVLVRPLRRREFLAAKLLMGLTYAVVLSALAAATAWGLAYAFGDLTGVRFGGEVVFTDSEMRITLLTAIGLNLLPQFATVTYAIAISTITRSTAASVGCAVGLWLFTDAVKYRLNVAPFLFSSYMEHAWQVFADRCNALDASWWPTAGYGAAASVAAMVLFCGLALYSLSRRDLGA